jgi:hypothetical protein
MVPEGILEDLSLENATCSNSYLKGLIQLPSSILENFSGNGISPL